MKQLLLIDVLRMASEEAVARQKFDVAMTLTAWRKDAIASEPDAAILHEPAAAVADRAADRAADSLAVVLLDWIDRKLIGTRTEVSDALESWAACRFGVIDGTEIQKLREFAAKQPKP